MERCLREDDAITCAAGGGDPGERDAWEAHLDACATCRELISLLATQSRPDDDSDDGDDAPRFFPRQAIGRFELRRPLGAGGMGVVFEAFDPQLGRRAAVKLLRIAAGDRSAEERLARESRALAQLSHPNVVTLYEAGRHGDEIFLAMELVDGPTIAEWLDARPGWREIVDAFVQAGRGLAAAHAIGLIHRDVKPENMLRGSDGRVRIGDFGVVRLDREDDAGAPPPERAAAPDDDTGVATRPGTLLGTPRYMAPEIRAGAAANRASDQYSFAASLWVALGGALAPARAASEHGGLDARAVRAPRWVRRVIERGLAREPAARWPSIDAMLRALDRRRRRARWIAAAGVATAAIAVFAGTRLAPPAADPCAGVGRALAGVWDPPRAVELTGAVIRTAGPTAPAIAIAVRHGLDARAQAWLALRGEVCRGEGAWRTTPWGIEPGAQTECLDRQRAALKATVEVMLAGRVANPRSLLDVVQDLPRADECASTQRLVQGERLPADPVRRHQLAAAADELDRAIARWRLDGDPETLATAQRIALETRDFPPIRARALQLIVWRQLDDQDPAVIETAHEAIRAAIEAGDQLIQAEVELRLIDASTVIAPRPAREVDWLLREAEARISALIRVAPGTGQLLRSDFLLARALVEHARVQLPAAIADASAAIALGEPLLGTDSWRLARMRAVLVASLLRSHRYAEALAQIEPTIPVIVHYLGLDHPELAAQLHALARAAYFVGDGPRALATAERARAIAERKSPPGVRVEIVELLGDIRMLLGDLAGGIREYETALTFAGKVPPIVLDEDGVRRRLGCARAALAARADRDPEARHRRLLAAAECLLAGQRPALAVALLDDRAASPPSTLGVRTRFVRARALADRARDGDLALATAEAARARRDCDQVAGCALGKEIDAWLSTTSPTPRASRSAVR